MNYPRVILLIQKRGGGGGGGGEGERKTPRRATCNANSSLSALLNGAGYAVYADVCHFDDRATVQLGTLRSSLSNNYSNGERRSCARV